MYCPNCGKERIENSRFCQHCGNKQKRNIRIPFIAVSALFILIIGYYLFYEDTKISEADLPASENATSEISTVQNKPALEKPVAEKQELEPVQERELTDIIASAQETVYTVLSDYSQGSGFLFNNKGTVVTNAHVVEGTTDVYIKTVNGQELSGKVIGYSNSIDVAIIHVPDLVGREPFAIEVTEPNKVGEEVIALGSPLGLENTATMGYITGQDRNFYIGSYTYKNLYQISAPISPGSSGGPLISKSTEKIIAINSAESTADSTIGFSIPLYTVNELITSWIAEPMSEDAILAQFYDVNGNFYFQELWEYSDGYFEGGYYSDENSYYDYWEYDYEDFWYEYGEDLWDYYDDDSYFDDWFEDYEYDEDWYDAYDEYDYEYDYDYEYEEDWMEEEFEYDYEEDWYDEEFEFDSQAVYFHNTLDDNWYYDELYDEWYYYDDYDDIWYIYDDIDDLFYEVEGF
ncbi:trypsin-like peptidase domain-containing protein [Oceanobacillus saliphilus]|uniref:trypsin-like peptidase domain-containing protein n=1 Tax=Oceanobacillus saliphilus TaxID=2925834 RepID=UPI00201E67AF|nr:trypsin-like peptidase domain-containing protein [Oceanobacillus saliphilus]